MRPITRRHVFARVMRGLLTKLPAIAFSFAFLKQLRLASGIIACHSPMSILFRILLLVFGNGVMNVVTAQSVAQRKTTMTTFTIDEQNNITAFGSAEEAAATTATPFDSFSSQKELAGLAAGWPPERFVAVWNGLPGVAPGKH